MHCDEPFARLLCQGMVLKDGSKMSKSKGNTVDPEDLIRQYGADTVRLFSMFAAPPEQSLEWTDSGVEGAFRFLRKLWKTVIQHVEAGTPGQFTAASLPEPQRDLRRKTHATIRKVSDDFGRRLTFNTAIAAVMELLNETGRLADRSTPAGLAVEREALDAAIRMLAPIVPHITHCLWQALGNDTDLLNTPWPTCDEAALARDTITLAVQVNGKLRGQFEASVDASREELEALARADANAMRFIDDKPVVKVIVVPGKLVNIVVRS